MKSSWDETHLKELAVLAKQLPVIAQDSSAWPLPVVMKVRVGRGTGIEMRRTTAWLFYYNDIAPIRDGGEAQQRDYWQHLKIKENDDSLERYAKTHENQLNACGGH